MSSCFGPIDLKTKTGRRIFSDWRKGQHQFLTLSDFFVASLTQLNILFKCGNYHNILNKSHWRCYCGEYRGQLSLWKRFRQWFLWIGGWEKANGQGWELRIPNGRGGWIWLDPTPVSLFGHWITFFGWGLQFRYRGQWVVWEWRKMNYCYLSSDGTPSKATKVFWGYKPWRFDHL